MPVTALRAALRTSIVSSFLVLVLIGFLLVPAFWLWGVIDGIVMLSSKDFRDGDGFPMH